MFTSSMLWLSLFAIAAASISALEVGDNLCIQGYVMDYYCINNVQMIDNGKTTLEKPFDHSVHCLVDVSLCYNTPFEILTDPASDGALYTRGYRLDDDSQQDMIRLAKSVGSCRECDNGYDSSKLEAGFRAVMKVTVLDLNENDDDAPPLVRVNEQRDASYLGDDPCRSEFDMEEGPQVSDPTTSAPTRNPTPAPTTSEPTPQPSTKTPTVSPVTSLPTTSSTLGPTLQATEDPAPVPTPQPSHSPTVQPSQSPTMGSTPQPVPFPTRSPTTSPSTSPVTTMPSTAPPPPTIIPTVQNPVLTDPPSMATLPPTNSPSTTSPGTDRPSTATLMPTMANTPQSPVTVSPTVVPTMLTMTATPTSTPTSNSPTSPTQVVSEPPSMVTASPTSFRLPTSSLTAENTSGGARVAGGFLWASVVLSTLLFTLML